MGYIEHRSKNSWRICVWTTVAGRSELVRIPLRMDPSLSEAVQRRDAERELALLEMRLSSQEATTWTLRGWSEEWLTKHVAPNRSPVTVANYRHLLDTRILPALGDLPLTDLTPARLTDWLLSVRSAPRKSTAKQDRDLSRPRSPSDRLKASEPMPLSANTVLHYYTCMEAMLAVAVRMGYLETNPMDRVERPRLRKHAPPAFGEQDALRLLAALNDQDNPHLRLAVHLALVCGLRLGEIVELRWSDLDWDAQVLSVSRSLKYTPATGCFAGAPKTDASVRRITLPDSLLPLLKDAGYRATMDALDAEDDGQDWLPRCWLIYGQGGRQLHHDTPSKWFRAFADANGFPGLRFHDLRHAHASLLLAHNIDVVSVSARMGHTSPSVTLSVYAHALPARDQDAARYFDALLETKKAP